MLPKEIIIDTSGWSELLLGVVIGAMKPPDRRYMDRRIPTTSFQPPNFKNKKYLEDSLKIADEIIEVMKPDDETHFRISPAYVLSSIRQHLQELGYKVEKADAPPELQEMVERSYMRWCVEVGIPEEIAKEKRRFWAFIEWVSERPHLREGLVKTGWASWERKWKKAIFEKSSDSTL